MSLTNQCPVQNTEATQWLHVQDGLPEDRDYYTIYAVVHIVYGVMLARGNERDWENGNFTHWHLKYRYHGFPDGLAIPVFP